MNRPELEQRWRRVLQKVEPPADFRDQLHHNLNMQLQSAVAATSSKRHRWGVAAGCAAGALVIGLLLAGAPHSPSLIAAAHAHANEERNVQTIDLTDGHWLSDTNLPPLPAGSRIVMAKECVLAGKTARHLRVTVSDSAQADVFITRAENGARQSKQGEIGGRNWWQAKLGSDIAVLVLFDADVELARQQQWTQQLSES